MRSSLRGPMSEDDFIAHLYPLLCALGCGHTQLLHSPGYRPDKAAHLPFQVLVRGQQAWVTTRRTAKLATGDEIVSVNDVPVSAIIQNGYLLYAGDGHVASFKELFLSEYDGFEDVCNKHYHWLPPYRLVIRTGSGALKNTTLDASDTTQVDKPAMQDKYADWTKATGTGTLGMYFHKSTHTALLEVRQLDYADTLVCGKCFEQIAHSGAKDLILDMRHNGGGDLRITIKLLSYLVNTDFGIVKDLYARLPDPSANNCAAYFDPGLTENFKASCAPEGSSGPFYHMKVRPEFGLVYAPIPPATTNRFNGKLWVLIDGATFSSAALFVSALKAQRSNTVFIGRETAGTDEGCNGFAMQKLMLPATKVAVQFPWLRVVSMAKAPIHGRGLLPDYPVYYTPQDVATGNDADLSKTLTLIGK